MGSLFIDDAGEATVVGLNEYPTEWTSVTGFDARQVLHTDQASAEFPLMVEWNPNSQAPPNPFIAAHYPELDCVRGPVKVKGFRTSEPLRELEVTLGAARQRMQESAQRDAEEARARVIELPNDSDGGPQ